MGTNAIGTALASGRAVQVFSAEHFVRTHHEWTCAGAPIRDPRSGRVLGAVDVSGPAATIHPTTLALVDTVARLAESELREHHRAGLDALRAVAAPILARSAGPAFAVDAYGWVAALDGVDPRARLTIPGTASAGRHRVQGIGDCDLEPLPGGWLVRVADIAAEPDLVQVEIVDGPQPLVRVSGAGGTWVHHPTPRHAQLLRLLADHPEGLTAADLRRRYVEKNKRLKDLEKEYQEVVGQAPRLGRVLPGERPPAPKKPAPLGGSESLEDMVEAALAP